MALTNHLAGFFLVDIPVLVLSYILEFLALAAVSWSVYLIIQGDLGDGISQQYNRILQANKVRLIGLAALLPSWISVPVVSTWLLILHPNDGSSPRWSVYPSVFPDCFKGWTILTVDSVMAAGVAFAIYKAQVTLDGLAQHYRSATNPPTNPCSPESRTRKAVECCISHADTVFLAITVTALSLTWLNVLFYAANYGFFVRHGTISDFFHCFGYTLCYILDLCQIIFDSTGPMIGAVGAFATLYYLASELYTHISRKKGIKDSVMAVAPWSLALVLSLLLSIGSSRSFMFRLDCQDMYWRLDQTVQQLYKPGNENQTITWTVFSNVTGNWNVTHDAWRPDPFPRFGIGPLDEEFKCTWTSTYQLLPFLGGAAGVALVYIAISQAFGFWSRRQALKQGRAYTAMHSEA